MIRPLVVLASIGIAATVCAERIEGIALRVNDRIMTTSELEARERDEARRLLADAADPAALRDRLADLRRELANEALQELLLLERAKEIGIAASAEDVDGAVRRMREQNQVKSDEEFRARLAESGLTEAVFRATLEKSLIIQRLIAREVQAALDPDDEALRELYNKWKEDFREKEKVRLSEILILAGPTPEERAAAKTKAEALRRRLQEGAAFAELAKEASEGSTKDVGGALGVVARGELMDEIDRVVFALAAGRISDPIETRFGFHVLRVDETFPPVYKPFADVKDAVRRRFQNEEYQKRLAAFVESLKKRYYVVVDGTTG